jgi:hypothetical protein
MIALMTSRRYPHFFFSERQVFIHAQGDLLLFQQVGDPKYSINTLLSLSYSTNIDRRYTSG